MSLEIVFFKSFGETIEVGERKQQQIVEMKNMRDEMNIRDINQATGNKTSVAWQILVTAAVLILLMADIYFLFYYQFTGAGPFKWLIEIQARIFGGYYPKLTLFAVFLVQLVALAIVKIILEAILGRPLTQRRK